MAGFKKHRRPVSVTAHVCHRLELPGRRSNGTAAGPGAPVPGAGGLSGTLGPLSSRGVPGDPRLVGGAPPGASAEGQNSFWTVKRRLPDAKIKDHRQPVSLDQAIAAVRKAGAWPEAPPAERTDAGDYKKKVDLLERRLAKVNGLLENNELEIKRLRKLKTADPGVASKFREVQGIADDDDQAEAKKEMMSAIFAANLKLKERVTAQS